MEGGREGERGSEGGREGEGERRRGRERAEGGGGGGGGREGGGEGGRERGGEGHGDGCVRRTALGSADNIFNTICFIKYSLCNTICFIKYPLCIKNNGFYLMQGLSNTVRQACGPRDCTPGGRRPARGAAYRPSAPLSSRAGASHSVSPAPKLRGNTSTRLSAQLPPNLTARPPPGAISRPPAGRPGRATPPAAGPVPGNLCPWAHFGSAKICIMHHLYVSVHRCRDGGAANAREGGEARQRRVR